MLAKFWLRDCRGCFRGDSCTFLQRVEDKGKYIKSMEDNNRKVNKIVAKISKPSEVSKDDVKNNIQVKVMTCQNLNQMKMSLSNILKRKQ